MKFLTPLLCLLFAQGIAIAQEPADLLDLVERRLLWEELREQEQEKIDKLYFAELDQLKENFTKAGNIAAAIAVNNEIEGEEKGEQEPAILTKLRDTRNKSLHKAVKPIDKKYWIDLKKLKSNFQQQGSLEAVLATDAEIEKVLAAYKKSPEPKKPTLTKANRDQETKADKIKGFEMEFVVIGNPNNEADNTGYGAVSYTYRIGKHEVSEAIIDAYNKRSRGAKITKDTRGANKPATSVSWNEAARFVNWLNTSQGHQAAYKFADKEELSNIELWNKEEAWQLGGENLYRHKDAHYFLPSENEWYKAAYYDPKANDGKGGYWDYATGSDEAPEAVASGSQAGTAVYGKYHSYSDTTNAGGSSPYGTMAQNGNAWDWVESARGGVNDSAIHERVIRGASVAFGPNGLRSNFRFHQAPSQPVWGTNICFRVASVAE